MGQSSRNEESESDAEPEAEPRVPCVCGRLNKPSCTDCRRCRPPAVEGGFRVFRLKSCFACRTVLAKNLCGACGARSYCSAECVLADWPRHKKECMRLLDGGCMDHFAGIRAMLVAREGSAGQRLVWASALGSVFAVRSLLAEGADVNFADEDGQFALIAAACWGYLDVSELLLVAGANVNLIDENSRSALTLACVEGTCECGANSPGGISQYQPCQR